MLRVQQICLLTLFTFVSINEASTTQDLPDWRADSTEIHTESLEVDFSSTNLVQSTHNTKLSDKGIQKADPDEVSTFVSKEIDVPIKNISPFLALGSRLVFDQSVDQIESIQFEIRHSPQKEQWSDWLVVEKDDHLTTRPDTLAGTLQYLPYDTRFIQFRVTLPNSPSAQELQLQSLNLSFTSPGSTPTKKLDEIRRKSAKAPEHPKQILQEYPMPDFIPRTDWGSPVGQQPSGNVSLTDVTHQIVHHTAGTNSSSDWPAVVRSIWDYHVNTNGWSDIGYNWLIDPNGVIYQGRGWINGNDEVQGAHFCGTNSNTMGVALMGNFEEVNPTSDSQNSLIELLAWKSDEKNIDPTSRDFHPSSGLNLYTISGHRDGCSTLCPGENLYTNLPGIREDVQQKIDTTTEPPETPGGLTVHKNYPNPFADETTITFSIGQPGNVRITIWNTAGKMVMVLSDQFYEAQTHSETWNAVKYAPGVYFCRVMHEEKIVVQKMILIR